MVKLNAKINLTEKNGEWSDGGVSQPWQLLLMGAGCCLAEQASEDKGKREGERERERKIRKIRRRRKRNHRRKRRENGRLVSNQKCQKMSQ